MRNVLRISELSAGYGERQVLTGVSLSLPAGERALLAGPNGSGKSTLLKAIAGVVAPSAGTVAFNGTPLDGWPTEKRIRSGMGYLAQSRNVFPSLSVHDNLMLSAMHDAEAAFAQRVEWVLQLFPFLGDKLARRAGLLSGGERQALAVGMVLMKKSDLYMFDEPTAGLAPTAAAGILDGLKAAQGQAGFACLIVEHNIRHVQGWIDRAIVMVQGRIVEDVADAERLRDGKFLEQHYF
ncbi:MAG: ATP-binding cassette domain-containing protein [FCB group bacterium]|jgi:branched-chain amino acid transport system ATP-binding protein|nr:ATP-binding cassette domain-containing protein [FCB group bacterium]